MINQAENDTLQQKLDELQQQLNMLVRKAESLRHVTQDISYQATLKRLWTNSSATYNPNKQKAFFPTSNDNESFERKFKLLRRSSYILNDEMREMKKFLNNLHDAVRLQKQEHAKLFKNEKIDEDIEIIHIKQEKQIKLEKPKPNPLFYQVIDLVEDDEIMIVAKVEQEIQIETDKLVLGDSMDLHISCICQLQLSYEMEIPFEVKLCIAYEAIHNFGQFTLSRSIISKAQKQPQILRYSNSEKCISYEMMYLIEHQPMDRNHILLQNNATLPLFQLELEKCQSDSYFPCFSNVSELQTGKTLFLYVFKLFFNEFRGQDITHQGGNFQFLVNQMHMKQGNGILINAFHPNLQGCQILNDFLESIVQLNGQNIIIGHNSLMFPESTKNPSILICRFTKPLSEQDLLIVAENMKDGCRIRAEGQKMFRLIIIFSNNKIFIPSIVGKVKHWEIPVDHLNEIAIKYHYTYLLHYIDLIVHCNIQDKLSKFYTLIISALREKFQIAYTNQILEQYDTYVNEMNYSRYNLIKSLNMETGQEQYQQRSQKKLSKVQFRNSEIGRLLGNI